MSRTQLNSRTDSPGETGTHSTQAVDSLSVSIADALAHDTVGTYAETTVQLYDHIDTEALDRLLAHSRTKSESQWELTFTVEDRAVTVTSDGAISVE